MRSTLGWAIALVLGFSMRAAADAGTPEPTTGRAIITIGSNVPAELSVDGNPSGTVPVELSITSGDHTLVFRDTVTGVEQKRVVTLKPGERRKETWAPAHGLVHVSTAAGAEVFIGDHSFGIAPFTGPLDVLAGHHTFRFVSPDKKRTVTKTVDVPPGRETIFKVDLR